VPSLTASFVDVLVQSVNFTHLCARRHVVNVLVPALAKLAAQLVVHLLIAAGPPVAAFLIGHLLRAHEHGQHLPDLEARCRLRLWRTRRNDWQRRSSSSTRGCVRSLALRGRAARAVCARTRQSCSPSQYAPEVFNPFHHRACQDGAPPGEGKQPFPSKQGLHVRPRGLRTALGKPMGSAYALVASGNSSSSRSHAARTRPRPPSTDRNQVTFQATKVCHCGVFSCNFFLRGALGIPIRISLGTIGSM
jgi:hypothetical protein